MKYIKLVISVKDEYQEPLIAELMEMEFHGFQQLDDQLITYIPRERFLIGNRERVEHLLANFPGQAYIQSEEIVADQNWNQTWEKTIKAQQIGPFLVKPTWSVESPKSGQILLEIDPKMSFGTGYHETTRLMLQALPDIIQQGDQVLDAGTGTGILAIAAIKLGAKHVVAFDIDEWSITNTQENIYLNGVSNEVTVQQGTHKIVDDNQKFDVILANIQQNVITDMMPFFAMHLKNGGNILFSGLLESDEDKIHKLMEDNNISYSKTTQENEWIAIRGAK